MEEQKVMVTSLILEGKQMLGGWTTNRRILEDGGKFISWEQF